MKSKEMQLKSLLLPRITILRRVHTKFDTQREYAVTARVHKISSKNILCDLVRL
jgi:hypothetical protein